MDLHLIFVTFLLAIFVDIWSSSGVSACQCSRPAHPQQYMCDADYVIRGKVLSETYVRKGVDKTSMKAPAPTQPPAPTTKRQPFKFPQWQEPQWWEPPLRPPSPREQAQPQWRNPFLGFINPPSMTLSDQPRPQASSPRIRERIRNTDEIPLMIADQPRLRPSRRLRAPQMLARPQEEKETFPYQYRRRYRMKVDKVYKGEERIAARSIINIYTEYDEGLCGKGLKLDTRYLLAGHFVDGEFFIGLCDWAVEKSQLTKEQRRGLRHTYKKYCDICKIKSGTFYWPPEAKEKDVCPYNPYLMDNTDCEGRYSSCIRYPDGTCNWMETKSLKHCRRKSDSGFL